jgi:predicted N-acetyltransferase YhbS
MQLISFDPTNLQHRDALVGIWNAASGADLAINARLVEYNTRTPTGAKQAGQIAMSAGQPIGFVLASALPSDPQTSPPEIGWIDAIAVAPGYQRQGIGSDLLDWGEGWLRAQGAARARLGGGLHPFVPGLPLELENSGYFKMRGYAQQREVWDVARDLNDLTQASSPTNSLPRPAQSNDTDRLCEFFRHEFPGRWRYEFDEFLRERGQIADYMLLHTSNRITGFARLTSENSERPIERFFPQRLPRPWGQIGPIGVGAKLRGQGLGRALLEGSLCELKKRGVRGCVIDWTDQIGFYGKFGFKPYRGYRILNKTLRKEWISF